MHARVGPLKSLPLPPGYTNEDDYVDELLRFTTSNDLLQLLTGGIHVLDFFTRDPDFFDSIIPEHWRQWFKGIDLCDIMDFILRTDLTDMMIGQPRQWRSFVPPPRDLLEYVWNIRRLLLDRTPQRSSSNAPLPVHIAVGMKVKKVREVASFSQYVHHLAKTVESRQNTSITHLVDFGAGQNYLGRALANPPINRRVVAVESKLENVETARRMDIPAARVAAKSRVSQREEIELGQPIDGATHSIDTSLGSGKVSEASTSIHQPLLSQDSPADSKIQYIAQRLDNGDLSAVIEGIRNSSRKTEEEYGKADGEFPDPNLMVISLHSCGNLSHHGLRSLVENPEVSVVAIVGCCYNLATERLTKPSMITSSTIPLGRLIETAGDPLGFPMSEKLCNYPVRPEKSGVHLNLTTRMMAVQAPTNWTPADYQNFITRHFYRSLLEKVFLDHGIIERPALSDPNYHGYVAGDIHVQFSAASGGLGAGPVFIVGKLSKASYASFVVYVRAALARLSNSGESKHLFQKLNQNITDDELRRYEENFSARRKDLGILWTLMSYSAGLAEAIMVVDRWQWLREQSEVAECWVEPVFEYAHSPRNLAIIGIKK